MGVDRYVLRSTCSSKVNWVATFWVFSCSFSFSFSLFLAFSGLKDSLGGVEWSKVAL